MVLKGRPYILLHQGSGVAWEDRNRPERGKNRHSIRNTFIRLFLERDFKSGDDPSIASCVGHKFFHSVFISSANIERDIVRVQNILFNAEISAGIPRPEVTEITQ